MSNSGFLDSSDLVARRRWGWVGLGRAGSEPTAAADPSWGGLGGEILRSQISPFNTTCIRKVCVGF